MGGHRMTMGQDHAGHAPLNPPDAMAVSTAHLVNAALSAGYQMKRDGRMWLYRASGSRDTWVTAGETNYLAARYLGLLPPRPSASPAQHA